MDKGFGASLANRLFDGLVQVDSVGRIQFWNLAAGRITGYPSTLVVGRPFQEQPARHLTEDGAPLRDPAVDVLMTARDGQSRDGLAHMTHADGFPLTLLTHTMPLSGKNGKIEGAVEIFTDNKALIAAYRSSHSTEETILFDPLTGIGNRPHIESKIRAALQGEYQDGAHFGLLFIDIDHFKEFNDTFGHLTGDKVLRLAANTLRQNLRGSDSCGRWGGEEFIVLINTINADGLRLVAEKLRQAVANGCVTERGQQLGVTISIGASLAREGDTLQTLVDRADHLMYESKRLGRNRVTCDG